MNFLIWIFGLFAGGAFGIMAGYAMTASPTGILLGAGAGMSAFVCWRLSKATQ